VRKILQTTTGATREKVEALLNELLDQTLLFSNLRPPLTIEEPARYLLDQLTEIPPARETREKLKSFLDDLTTWDSLSMEGSSIRYRELITSASQIHARQSENPVQVDSAFHLSGDSISCLVGAEVARAAELLVRLSPLPPGIPHLQAYREAFVARYGHEREVSLLELLDPHFGLGPPSKIASTHESTTGEKRQANRRNDVLLQIACEALRDCNPIVELDEETLKSLETWNPSPENAPVTLDMNAFVAAESPEAIDRGEFKVIVGPNIGASAAGRNLGRFAYLLGPEARRALNKAAQFEESRLSQAIWAEIVYLPRKLRSANVSIRPNAREYEIAYGVFPGGGADRILPLDELVVGVHDRRFYLRWPRKNAEVKIASGHMLNYADAPSICRFLSEVRLDSQPHLHAFDWGSASAFPFLPRIQVGRIVLCPARWRIDAGISKRWFLVKTPDLFQDAFRAWRKRWNVPRHVFLSAGDNRLLIDTENESQLAELKRDTHRLKDGYPLILEEVLPALHENWLVGPGGHYVSELVVSLSLDGKPVEDGHRLTKTLPLEENVSQIPSEMRLSPPGSSWLYLKLYAPQELEEDLLLQPLRPFLETVLDQGLAHDYFFVRYSDPNPHLRLRFRGEPQRLVASLLPELTTLGGKLMTQGLCTHFTFDTYDREIERYGGAEAIGPAESIFAADSRAVMGLFRVMRQEKLVGSAERMIVGVLSVSDFLNSLKLEDADMALWRRSQQSDRHEAGQEFREHKERLLAFLREPTCILGEDGAKDLTRLLADRRQALASFRDTLYRLKTEKKLTAPIHHICESLVHMHCNRLFGTDRALERKVTGMYLRVCEAVSSTY
jgi:thiopeptide-type bacteriocin biosynthesis protein